MPKNLGFHSSQTSGRDEHGHVNKNYYERLTDAILDNFYPKQCCGKVLKATDGIRRTVLRCPVCHRQQSKLSGTPLNHLKVPRWMFGYLLREAQTRWPQVLTSHEIQRRLGVGSKTALLLKRRIQLFCSDVLPRMQRKFYQDMKLMYHDFKFPTDRSADLTEIVKGKPIPQTDTVVLFSCSTTANKGRKRFKHTGQTASIYMSESLGGMQRGTLVSTLGVKNGPCFFDSISNQKASTLIPAIGKYIPMNTPLFSDEGYKFFPGRNHRAVNHSLKSKDKRRRFARDRWSRLGVHCNVAEGNQSAIKQAFRAYRWINPVNSTLYLNEYTALRNLKYFNLDDLLPVETARNPSPVYKLDRNWEMREKAVSLCPKFFSYNPRKQAHLDPPAQMAHRLTSLTIQP